ncbi:hypothetical protein MTP03_33320 [Tsukamurella sp. PLM1]|nr:hypothetical protein MTP03_33320 [Tsukamurella sp. PLM1]
MPRGLQDALELGGELVGEGAERAGPMPAAGEDGGVLAGEVTVGQEVGDERRHRTQHPLHSVVRGEPGQRRRSLPGGVDRRDPVVDDGDEETVLVADAHDRTRADLGLGRDAPHRGGRESVLAKQAVGRGEHPDAGLRLSFCARLNTFIEHVQKVSVRPR